MNSTLVRKAAAVAGLLAASFFIPAFGAESAYAVPDKGPVAFQFRYQPADLETQRGAHKVYRTLVNRATRACMDPGTAPISLQRVDSACVSSLVEGVVRQIGSESLAQERQRASGSNPRAALAQVRN